MHQLLERHLKRAGVTSEAPPSDASEWRALLERISRAYTEADQDRYLLERSLSLSSAEMRGLQADLARERDALRAVMTSLTEGLCALNREAAILFINPQGRRLLGLDDSVCGGGSGPRLHELVRAEDDAGRGIEDIVRAPSSTEERRLIIRGDRDRFIVYGLTPIGDVAVPDGVVMTLRDITSQKQAESEREGLQRSLVDASRRAGMAEVATGVLHNVGNALNSVNVSATLAGNKVRSLRLDGLRKAAGALQDNRERLTDFFSQDRAGRQLPEYLSKLTEQLERDQHEVLDELSSLVKNLDHIKEVVATQQSNAKALGVDELVSIKALVEDAVRINAPSLARHGIAVVRDYEDVPSLLLDKHVVVQILVNLISNAKHAMKEVPPERRRLTLRIRPTQGTARGVRVEVEDRGVGIAPEHMGKIFRHGFTTRENGHGFGLHTSSLSAKALGAALTVHSEGVDRGALFVLELPLGKGAPA